jgi:hypothetical protein
MKPGSLVECINNSNMEIVKMGTPYTIRQILKKGEVMGNVGTHLIIIMTDAVYLEEVSEMMINIGVQNLERPFAIERFRELLPPIANIEEHINKEVLKPELV